MQDPGQQEHLQEERYRGRPVEVRLSGDHRHQRRGQEQDEPLGREKVDERKDAPLRQHGEGEQQQHRREQVDELRAVVGEHQRSSSTCTSRASTASMNAVPRNSGARKMRIFALTISIAASAAPPAASLAANAGSARTRPSKSPPWATRNGKNNASPRQE